MPSQQSLGLHEEPTAFRRGYQLPEACQQSPVRRPESRAGNLATEYGHLMARHENLDGKIFPATPSEPHHFAKCGGRRDRRTTGPRAILAATPHLRKPQVSRPDEILGTHRVRVHLRVITS